MQRKWKKLLPSSKFVKSLAVIVGIILIIYAVGFFVNKSSVFEKNSGAEPIVVKDIVESDMDNDGLKDWEEALWGLDPNNRDTNGNGISDADEVAMRREKLASLSGGIEASSDTSTETRTDQFAEQIVQLVSALQASGELSNENQQAIVEQIVAYAENTPLEKKYTADDVHTVKETQASIEDYITSLNSVLDPATTVSKDDLQLLINIDPDQFELLQPRYSQASKKYQVLLSKLEKLPVPESIAYEHVELMNGLNAIKTTFDDYQLLETDPILMLQRFASLDKTLSYFGITAQNLSTKLKALYNS